MNQAWKKWMAAALLSGAASLSSVGGCNGGSGDGGPIVQPSATPVLTPIGTATPGGTASGTATPGATAGGTATPGGTAQATAGPTATARPGGTPIPANVFFPGTYKVDYVLTIPEPDVPGSFNFVVDGAGAITPTTISIPTVGNVTFSGTISSRGVVQTVFTEAGGTVGQLGARLPNVRNNVRGSGLIRTTAPGRPPVLGTFTLVKQS